MDFKVKLKARIRLLISWFWQYDPSFIGEVAGKSCLLPVKDPLYRSSFYYLGTLQQLN
jgi:hypothetical protein